MMRHVAIIPARDEAATIGRTLDSLLRQSMPVERIIVVDDGSSDATAEIVKSYSKQDPRVELILGPKSESRRYRVVEVFNRAYDTVRDEPYDLVSKLDADLVFPTDYFEQVTKLFEDPSVGAASGVIYEEIGGRMVRFRLPENHVPGMLKTYRKDVFDRMGGFRPVLGWDIIDLVAMRQLGYRARTLANLHVVHLRRHGSAGGSVLKGHLRMGRGAYIIGAHPVFHAARSVYRMLETPYILGGLCLWLGYVAAWASRTEQLDDPQLVEALRREQLHRLAHGNRLPEPDLAAGQPCNSHKGA